MNRITIRRRPESGRNLPGEWCNMRRVFLTIAVESGAVAMESSIRTNTPAVQETSVLAGGPAELENTGERFLPGEMYGAEMAYDHLTRYRRRTPGKPAWVAEEPSRSSSG